MCVSSRGALFAPRARHRAYRPAAHARLPPVRGTPSAVAAVALDPSELEGLDEDAIKERLQAKAAEAAKAASGVQVQKEDLSDMVAEHAARQSEKRRRQEQQRESGRTTAAAKKFKF